jgi:hypothetical protein
MGLTRYARCRVRADAPSSDTDLSRVSARSGAILFVNLGGRGGRGLASGPRGLYIPAGPNGDEKQSFAIYLWNGRDQVGGAGRKKRDYNPLCELGPYGASKPERLAYVDTQSDGGMQFVPSSPGRDGVRRARRAERRLVGRSLALR